MTGEEAWGGTQGNTTNADVGRNKKTAYGGERVCLEGTQQLETKLIRSSIYPLQRKDLAVVSRIWEDSVFISSRQLAGFMKLFLILKLL